NCIDFVKALKIGKLKNKLVLEGRQITPENTKLARMDLLLVSIPKGLVLIELVIFLYIRHFCLLSHILPLKLRITFISCLTYPFITHSSFKGYFGLSYRFLVNCALIPIVRIVKSRVQLYLILLVRYCPLWALEAGQHGFIFGFLPKRPRTNRIGHLFIY
ncbi:hypothetical protein IGI04_012876, partial [Brassica rapa subsp. trilocularis]